MSGEHTIAHWVKDDIALVAPDSGHLDLTTMKRITYSVLSLVDERGNDDPIGTITDLRSSGSLLKGIGTLGEMGEFLKSDPDGQRYMELLTATVILLPVDSFASSIVSFFTNTFSSFKKGRSRMPAIVMKLKSGDIPAEDMAKATTYLQTHIDNEKRARQLNNENS